MQVRADTSADTNSAIDNLIASFQSIKLEVIAMKGRHLEADHPHYSGLVGSVLIAVKRLLESESEGKHLAIALMVMVCSPIHSCAA